MSETTITKKRSILKTLCKESTLFHVIASIILAIGAFFLDYAVAVWEAKTFGLIVDDGGTGNNIANIALLMFFNAAGTFVAWITLKVLLKLLRSGISQVIALVHYCYLPLTEDEVRGKFDSVENYLRYMENELEYIKYYLEDGFIIRYKTVTEDDIRKILQVCHKVFGSGSIFYGIYSNRRKPNGIEHDWFEYCGFNGMAFVKYADKKTTAFVDFMEIYIECKKEGQPFKEATVINEDGTVTLSYIYKHGKHMDKVDADSITF